MGDILDSLHRLAVTVQAMRSNERPRFDRHWSFIRSRLISIGNVEDLSHVAEEIDLLVDIITQPDSGLDDWD